MGRNGGAVDVASMVLDRSILHRPQENPADFSFCRDHPSQYSGSGLDVLLNSIESLPSKTSGSSSNISETSPDSRTAALQLFLC